MDAKIAPVQIEKAARVAIRAIQFPLDTLSGTRKNKDDEVPTGMGTNLVCGAATFAPENFAGSAAKTLARITPQPGQAAGEDWSCGKGAWPHLGHWVNGMAGAVIIESGSAKIRDSFQTTIRR